MRLKSRIADISVAGSISDILVGDPRIVRRDGKEQWVIDLTDDYSLFMVANHNNNPCDADGEINWGKVRRVKIIHIGEK